MNDENMKHIGHSDPSMDSRHLRILHSATNIVKKLRDSSFEAYFVGGCVRDMLLEQTTDYRPQTIDIDIATSAKPEDIEKLFKKTIPVGKQFGVMIVIEKGVQFEVATFRSDGAYVNGRHPQEVHFSSAKEDVKRRDFTINGLFYDPIEDHVIDHVDGQNDLKAGIIRAIGDPRKRFEEDKLRILRAIRFATRFAYQIEEKTFQAIKEYVSEIDQVSMERIRDELVKMLTGKAPESSLRMLDEVGLLEKILPEVTDMKGVTQNPEFHPEGDVFVHTMLMMQKLSKPSLVLAFATLLHDVGKPPTHDPETLKTTFHSDVGARMSEKILRRLRFSNDDIEQISWCVRNHMNFMHVQRMREGKLKRMMSLDTFPEELELHRIDCASSHGMLDNYEFLLKKQDEFREEDLRPKPILNGTDLISLGFKPGPQFKEILDEAWDLQLEHKFTTKDDAIKWVKSNYKVR